MTAHESKIVGEGLTYDDVLLVPAFSEVLPREVSIRTKFTKNIILNVPIVLQQWILLQKVVWLLLWLKKVG